MKVLIVAHPDDEILWFNPEEFDRIVIVFLGRLDKKEQGEGRRRALEAHPLKDKIECLGLTESGHWRDKSVAAMERHQHNRVLLERWLHTVDADEVTTHDAKGEYQHLDHVLVHNACMEILKCKVNGKDPVLYRKIRQVYVDNNCWTWYS